MALPQLSPESASSTRRPLRLRRARRDVFRAAALLGMGVSIAFAPNVARARDILRPNGGGGAQGKGVAGASNTAGSAAAAQAGANARSLLARTTQAVQAAQSFQKAAQSLAISRPSTVPNGLVLGGLQVAPAVPKNLAAPGPGENAGLWLGAKLPVQTSLANGGAQVTIQQTAPQAVLNWQTFNVGQKTDVYFNQRGGSKKDGGNDWIAFNKISDPSGVPSQILGSIHGEGTVYLINANGIVFGGASQINLHSFVASALPINDTLLDRGLLNNPDEKFLFSATPLAKGQAVAAFAPTISDAPVALGASTSYTTLRPTETGTTPTVSYFAPTTGTVKLVAGTDYSTAAAGEGKTTVQFTPAGLAKVGAQQVLVSYTASDVHYGNVVVEAGARLSAPTTAAHTGGRIALVGANVTNRGTISTPDGQTILAAGLQVGVAAHASSDSTLRGLDVYVGAVADSASTITTAYAGSATNAGLISSARGSTILTGKTVGQLGVIDSSTSVSLNGRVDLLANYDAAGFANATGAPFLYRSTGTVTLGAGSTIRIVPEVSDGATEIGNQLALASIVNVQGRTIHMGAGATLLAPNASLPGGDTIARDSSRQALTAGVQFSAGVFAYSDPGTPPDAYSVGGPSPQDRFVHSTGQIYLEAGATIDVAGSTGASAPVSENILSLQLRGSELADSPLQRDGLIRGQTLSVDVRQQGIYNGFAWVGTPLGDVSGFAGLIERSAGELTAAGGTVNLTAGDSVVMQKGSSINVSGGYISYEGGMVQTTRLLSGGRIVDIAQATPDQVYDGIYSGTFVVNHPKYGLTETFSNPIPMNGAHYEEGYLYGAAGGSITIQAGAMALDGELKGNTVAGARQRSVLPAQSSLSLTFHPEDPNFGLVAPPTAPRIVFGTPGTQAAAADFVLTGETAVALRADRKEEVILSPELVSTAGFGALTIDNSDGSISVPAGVSLLGLPGGALSFKAANLDIAGHVVVPGGTLSFAVYDISPSITGGTVVPAVNAARGRFRLGAEGLLQTSGLLVDDRAFSANAFLLPLVTDGGSISISTYDAALAPGSVVDVSAGVALSAAGKPTYGKAGSITIAAGQDLTNTAVIGGRLELGGTLLGYGGPAGGGSLSIQATRVQVGGTTADERTLLLTPGFFSRGGFSSISLAGLGEKDGTAFQPGLLIAAGTQIAPVTESAIALADAAGNLALLPTTLPEGVRAPVKLSFTALGVQDNLNNNQLVIRGDLVMEAGASVVTDPLGSVSFKGDTVALDGTVRAPGGTISVSGGGNSLSLFLNGRIDNPLTTVALGAHTLLSTAGTMLLTPDPANLGRRMGQALPGGTITVSGNLLAERGATIDVSGTSGTLDLAPAYSQTEPLPLGARGPNLLSSPLTGNAVVATHVESNGGAIVLKGSQELYSAATLIGAAGGALSTGGSLTVSSGRFYLPTADQTPLDSTLVVTQAGTPLAAATGSGIGRLLQGADGKALPGQGYFGANSYEGGGFDYVTLKGTVAFSGPVTLTAGRGISVGSSNGSGFGGGIIQADSAVRLVAPRVQLGLAFAGPAQTLPAPYQALVGGRLGAFPVTALYGAGSLGVDAQLIEVGNLSLQGIGELGLHAGAGEIRGDGTLDVAGRITLQAGQIYPPTAVSFTISASDYTTTAHGVTASHAGVVTVLSGGTRELPLSAGGALSIYASVIEQAGVLRAPIGTIALGWDGTGTAPVDALSGKSVPVAQAVTLAAGSITSVSAVDPLTGASLVIPYGLNLNGTSWIDPTGVDITARGVPAKGITIGGVKVVQQAGSTLDLRGGGDLLAYRFVAGTGGSTDLLGAATETWSSKTAYASHTLVTYQGQTWSARQSSTGQTPGAGLYWKQVPTSYAVVPSYTAGWAPYAPFATGAEAFSGDGGYVSASLATGDQVYLQGGAGLKAGHYTLLPARYALLPGAFLVTQRAGVPLGSQAVPDGSALVSGYRFNGLASNGSGTPVYSSFEVSPGAVVQARADYELSFANTFLAQGAIRNGAAVPRVPQDAGHLILKATGALSLAGAIRAEAPEGRGGLVDIASANDIRIVGLSQRGVSGELVLRAGELSGIGAESLLIGGVRDDAGRVTIQTSRVTVDDAGSVLTGADVALVAKNGIAVTAGSALLGSGSLPSGSEALQLGSSGALLRVSADPAARSLRTGVDSTLPVSLTLGAGVTLGGGSVTLDSTDAVALDPTTQFRAETLSLSAGRIVVALGGASGGLPAGGLVLSGAASASAQQARTLSLTGYRSIDFGGEGDFGSTALAALSLHSGDVRGFGGGTVTLRAGQITLDNAAHTGGTTGAIPTAGTLTLAAQTIRLGAHDVAVEGFAATNLQAATALQFVQAGSVTADGSVSITTPTITGASFASQTITAAGGALTVAAATPARTTAPAALGASLTLAGQQVSVMSAIALPSGQLTLHATAGDVTIGAGLSTAGAARKFYDLTRTTDGGDITLVASGSVVLGSGAALNVSAPATGSNAGSITIQASDRLLLQGGTLAGSASAGFTGGSFSLDAGSLLPVLSAPAAGANLAALNDVLLEGGFNRSIVIRDRHDASVLLAAGTGDAKATEYRLSADAGSIDVTGRIDASGATGGTIVLQAAGSVTLASSARLTVHGDVFSHAGKGGSVSLEAGSAIDGAIDPAAMLNLQAGAEIDLGVTEAKSANAALAEGEFTGTLHLRAPRTSSGSGVQMSAIASTILAPSSVVVEGYRLYTAADGSVDDLKTTVAADAGTWAAFAGTGLLTANPSAATLAPVTTFAPGVEIVNPNGDLTLASDWNLGAVRVGTAKVPGILTLRASGNLVFTGSLSDGFATAAYNAQLLTQNAALPLNAQSWSYRLTAGADLAASDYRQTAPLPAPAAATGSLLLGVNGGLNIVVTPDQSSATTAAALAGHYQVIRTGSGNIDISTAGDVKLLNQFATIYTAGTRVADAKMGGTFDLPVVNESGGLILGAVQESPGYTAQFSVGGGDVTLRAGRDILHQTQALSGETVDDSERQMPTNWLNRRGYVDPATGLFGTGRFGGIASTAWWVDFANYFEGVGALGGGNVTMIAGNDVRNVDALIPTNARMAGKGADGKAVAPNASGLVELGGGDLTLRAGHDLSGGTYYVESGEGTLRAGDLITTNATRSPSLTVVSDPTVLNPATWLPTTLFAGHSSFDVSARGDVLLGPVANAFLLPEGVNNSYWYKTYFSTYGADAAVRVSSLGGSVTVRERISLLAGQDSPILQEWYRNELLLQPQTLNAASYQPWLRLNETKVDPFTAEFELMPATLSITALSGNINVVGHLTLSPSPSGTVDLVAAGSINAVNPSGEGGAWTSSTINLSDASPLAVPGAASPYAYQTLVGIAQGQARETGLADNQDFLSFIGQLFAETGSTTGAAGSLQVQQALHAPGPLHAGDADPVHLYAAAGDISGLTLYAGKAARVIAGRDLTDVGFYVQNVSASDVSVFAAGRDIVAYDPNSPLRSAAIAAGNIGLTPSSGDLQISGPGTLEVLAGRDLNLGVGANNPDGTGVGLVSIGNARNPHLAFAGASIVAAAGIGSAAELSASQLDVAKFVTFLLSADGERYRTELAAEHPEVADLRTLAPEEQAQVALAAFYLVLRDAGRDHNDPTAVGGTDYAAAKKAIATLFPAGSARTGDISLTSREVKTRSGGDISLLAPNGQLTVGYDIGGTQPLDQGILTEAGGRISIFTKGDVIVGTSRIFTLRGGDVIIYSAEGDIAAGASSKTVQSAPPTRVLVDPQTADVKTDLAGLATGGGIGVLATVAGVAPGNVDLIAPTGTIDAGDAGIRATGNLNLAAVQVLNASNISVGGSSSGAPSAPSVSAPSLGSIAAASSAAGATAAAGSQVAGQQRDQAAASDLPSLISAEVVGYGDDSGSAL